MLKIGTIGSGSIMVEFINATRELKDLEISCIYSRSLDKAKIFALKNNLHVRTVDSFEEMLEYIDAIYIASPNGLHYQQAKYFLQQQKHVFVEKPATFFAHQLEELKQIALVNNVILLEAFKPIHLPEYNVLKKTVDSIKPFVANFLWNNYSGRMNEVLMDEYNSVFDEQLGKGSLYDALIYPVELAVALFGPVQDLKAMSHKLKNGVDINNIVILRHYNNIITNIVTSKAAMGVTKSEILSYDKTITFEHLTQIRNLEEHDRVNKTNHSIAPIDVHPNKLYYELKNFSIIVNTNDVNEMKRLLDLSIEAIRVLETVSANEKIKGEIVHENK